MGVRASPPRAEEGRVSRPPLREQSGTVGPGPGGRPRSARRVVDPRIAASSDHASRHGPSSGPSSEMRWSKTQAESHSVESAKSQSRRTSSIDMRCCGVTKAKWSDRIEDSFHEQANAAASPATRERNARRGRTTITSNREAIGRRPIEGRLDCRPRQEVSQDVHVDDATATMIANFPARTGRPLDDWVRLARGSGLTKHGQIVSMLKAEHGMTHGFANFVANRALAPDDAPSEDDLVDAMYSGPKASLRPLHDAAVATALAIGTDIELAPKKAYVSLRRSKQFASVGPGPGRAPRDRPESGWRRAAGTSRADDRDVHASRADRHARGARWGARRLAPAGLRKSVTYRAFALG